MVDVICVGLEGLAWVEHGRKAISSAEPLEAGRADTYLSHTERPSKQTAAMPATLYSTFFTSSAENLAAFCLLTISSSFGCFHVPVVGVEGADCVTGVEGRTGVDIAKS